MPYSVNRAHFCQICPTVISRQRFSAIYSGRLAYPHSLKPPIWPYFSKRSPNYAIVRDAGAAVGGQVVSDGEVYRAPFTRCPAHTAAVAVPAITDPSCRIPVIVSPAIRKNCQVPCGESTRSSTALAVLVGIIGRTVAPRYKVKN